MDIPIKDKDGNEVLGEKEKIELAQNELNAKLAELAEKYNVKFTIKANYTIDITTNGKK